MARGILLRKTSVQDVVVTPHDVSDADPERLHHHPTLALDDVAAAQTAIPGLAGASLALSGPTVVAYGAERCREGLVAYCG